MKVKKILKFILFTIICNLQNYYLCQDKNAEIYFDNSMKTSDLNKALIEINKAIKLNPTNSEYFNRRGVIYCKLYKYNEGILDFTNAIKLNNENYLYYQNRGTAFVDIKNYKKAIYDYNKVIQLKENETFSIEKRAYCKEKINDYRGAIADFDRAIIFNPNNDYLYAERAYNKVLLNDFKGAIDDYFLAIELNPKNSDYYNYRGVAYYNLKDLSNAILDFNSAIELNPKIKLYHQNKLKISEEINKKSNEKYIVSAVSLNMREGAGINYKIITTLSEGDEVELIDNFSNEWWKVVSKEYEGYVVSKFLVLDQYSDWDKKNYQTGTAPDCENVTPKYNYEIDNFLNINVGSNTDVVVKLMRIDNFVDECIRIVYVRGGESFKIKNIPEGKYYLKIAYGKDYRSKIINNQCYVKFIKNAQYEKGKETLNFYNIREPDSKIGDKIYKNWSIPSFELSLDVALTNSKQFGDDSKNISEIEFNK
jgi:tetratricopeptide (TPR) repeat protein